MADNQDSAENQENATTASLRRWGRAPRVAGITVEIDESFAVTGEETHA